MEWLNYHHLYYFWFAAKEGSLTKAAQQLKLTHPALSTQIRTFESNINQKLFSKNGRSLQLTEMGLMVYRYAEDIFSTGRELLDVIHNRPVSGKSIKFSVGIAQVVPKLIAKQLLDIALKGHKNILLNCHEDKLDSLITQLAGHKIDAILSDTPLPSNSNVKAYSYLLGKSKVSFFAANQLKTPPKFPELLQSTPVLLPLPNTRLRKCLDQWFESKKLRPQIIAEFDDSALMKVFGEAGTGVFPSPQVIEKEVCRQYHARVVGRIKDIHEEYYIISPERKIKHPVLSSLFLNAKTKIFK